MVRMLDVEDGCRFGRSLQPDWPERILDHGNETMIPRMVVFLGRSVRGDRPAAERAAIGSRGPLRRKGAVGARPEAGMRVGERRARGGRWRHDGVCILDPVRVSGMLARSGTGGVSRVASA